ncbi:hypothetical protein PHLCEN_2v5039 [Hermanssonia centrifuga]|uniref:Uncharacterized protein n=1 Tax=Hermanssonia centrifuga TaxID=98765 RepID=A0A2R6PC66_9APHY|nr:hypothetical protein PHLCEN_2v5039 [Hermanssonia centrifuga]
MACRKRGVYELLDGCNQVRDREALKPCTGRIDARERSDVRITGASEGRPIRSVWEAMQGVFLT